MNERRFGEFGTGGLGFFGGLFSPDGKQVFAHGLNGSFHRWVHTPEQGLWQPELAITGHPSPVKDVVWDPKHQFFLSASLDQSTRLHGVWRRDGVESWHELNRPQSHGYDMQALAFIGGDSSSIASAADEKIVRTFEAPKGWVRSAKKLGVIDDDVDEESRPLGASLPPQSLSNRLVKNDEHPDEQAAKEKDEKERDWSLSHSYGAQLARPPVEEQLVTSLWPESNKLFGHGYELFSIAAAHHSNLVATACKAQSAKHAVVRITDAIKGTHYGNPLEGHTLTITRIQFSPDDQLILSVSRDRTWRLFEKKEGDDEYMAVAANKSHGRIIWDCSFSDCGNAFVTASRDKTARVWCRSGTSNEDNSSWDAVSVLKFEHAATAVSLSGNHLAVGLENGVVEVFEKSETGFDNWSKRYTVEEHNAFVNRVHLSNRTLLSCSEDNKIALIELK